MDNTKDIVSSCLAETELVSSCCSASFENEVCGDCQEHCSGVELK